MSKSSLEIAKEFSDAMVSGDVETAAKFVADDVISISPLGSAEGKETWLAHGPKAALGVEWSNFQEITEEDNEEENKVDDDDTEKKMVTSDGTASLGFMTINVKRTITLREGIISKIVIERK